MKKIQLEKAQEKIIEFSKTNLSDFYNHEEFSAAITHWIHTPKKRPPCMPKNVFKKLLELFYTKKQTLTLSHINKNMVAEEQAIYQPTLSFMMNDIPFPPPKNPKFTFIDLFAGIGGFRTAMQKLGGKCVFSSEWDKYSKKTYEANFGEVPYGDIKQIDETTVPNHDILCAGFPCQVFSIAGKRKGFDETRGTLFFDVARIIKEKQPKAFFLENVKGLKSHNKGETLNEILKVLRGSKDDGYLDYYVPDPQIINAKNFGVPQNRERIFIVGFRKDLNINSFNYPRKQLTSTTIKQVLEKNEVSVKYYLSTQYLKTLRTHRARHESKGNGFGYEIIPEDGIANAVVCGGMGRERNLVYDHKLTNFIPITRIKGEVNREGIRKMTPREWARLQGYSDEFKISVADAQAYKQFGNSVAVPAILATAEKIIKKMSGI